MSAPMFTISWTQLIKTDQISLLYPSGPLTPVPNHDQHMGDAGVTAATATSGTVDQVVDDENIRSMKRLRMSESMEAFPNDSADEAAAAANRVEEDEDTEGSGMAPEQEEDIPHEDSMTE